MFVSVISFVFPGLDNVRCAFSTKAAGNVSFSVGEAPALVTQARRSLRCEFACAQWAELNQVHGDTLVFEPQAVDEDCRPEADGDGMATATPGLALMIRTADCQPLLLAHNSGKFVAALHVGWRGNRRNFPASGLAGFCVRYGLRPCDVLAVRGPSLGPARAEFVNFDREWGPEFAPWFDADSRTMDLWSLTRDQLTAAGLRPRHIYGLDLCTFSNSDQFFSYRRERVCGRQAGLIRIEG
ncbi:MAG: polyphenol oxidase family protein [Desulfovibrio sp.]|nr:polyphenol oxidase family protein [Desulfovibrio sp.]